MTAAIQLIVEKLKNKRHRWSPQRNFYGIWKKFNEFFIRLDCKLASWEERIVLYVGFLIKNKRQSAMIKSYISAIKSVLQDDGVFLNQDQVLLTSLTQACRLKNDRVRTRLPIRLPMLKMLVAVVDSLFDNSQPYLEIMYRAMLVVSYFGLLRIGEIAQNEHIIRAKDVHEGMNKNKLMFILHSSTQEMSKEGHQFIHSRWSQNICKCKKRKRFSWTILCFQRLYSSYNLPV